MTTFKLQFKRIKSGLYRAQTKMGHGVSVIKCSTGWKCAGACGFWRETFNTKRQAIEWLTKELGY